MSDGDHGEQNLADGFLSRLENLGDRYSNLRFTFSKSLTGTGIEIGALHNPFPVPSRVKVFYADKSLPQERYEVYPDLLVEKIVKPHIICDNSFPDQIRDRSLDFVIASHVLEHMDNPLKAMLAWHRILKPGGVVLCVVPEARFTFDKGRPLTTLDHLVWDFVNDGTELKSLSDLFHIAECNLNMHDALHVEAAVDQAKKILKSTSDTHFHVWTYDSFLEQMETLIRDSAFPFKIRDSASDNKHEMLFLFQSKSVTASFYVPGQRVMRARR